MEATTHAPTHEATAVVTTAEATAPMATVTPSFTPTPRAIPTAPAGAEIQLLGPPPGATFQTGDVISFYWTWPLPLPEDHYLSLYLLTSEDEILLGRAPAPNVGSSFSLHIGTAAVAEITTADTWQWQIRLEFDDVALAVSESRLLIVASGS